MPELPKKKSGSISRIIIKCLWIFFCVGIVSITLLFFFIAKGFIGYMPPIEELQNPKDKFASEIYSSDMEVIGRYYQSKGNRVYVGYNEILKQIVSWAINYVVEYMVLEEKILKFYFCLELEFLQSDHY